MGSGLSKGPSETPLPPLADNITRLRKARRLTVVETARKAGVSREHLYRIEKGQVLNPGRETLIGIAAAIGVPLGEVIRSFSISKRDTLLEQLSLHSANICEEDWSLLEEIVARSIKAA